MNLISYENDKRGDNIPVNDIEPGSKIKYSSLKVHDIDWKEEDKVNATIQKLKEHQLSRIAFFMEQDCNKMNPERMNTLKGYENELRSFNHTGKPAVDFLIGKGEALE